MYINVQAGLLGEITLEKKCTCLETFGHFTEFFLLDHKNVSLVTV